MALHHARLDQFSWDKTTRTLSAEASDLGLLVGLGMPRTFTVMSTHNVEFTLTTTHTDAENDVTHWTYHGWHGRPITLIIFND